MAVATTHSSSALDAVEIRHPSYPPAAFRFVLEGLAFTTERAYGQYASEGLPVPDMHHVSGQQLCLGLREFAIDRYGMMAPCVLRHWNIARTEDFGRIVYALIDAGRLTKSTEDSIDDFHAVFEFDEAFSPSALAGRVRRA
jgi:uncharacterized repeat protein (TIGR04138 family)